VFEICRVATDDRPQAGGYSAESTNPMIQALQSELGINVIASIIVSALFLAVGFAWGKYKERKRKFGKNLEEYDFYPFIVTRENFGEFSLKDFRLGMHYFLKNEDHTAARQLIFIGSKTVCALNSSRPSKRFMLSYSRNTTVKKLLMTRKNSSKTTSASCG
jgi:hypothetical protein